MSKSRYSDAEIIDDHHYGTFSLPVKARGYKELNLLEGVKTFDYVYKVGDRLDALAAKFFSQDQYWWVVATINNIQYPFASGGLVPGKVLKIPYDVKDVFERMFK
jgi:hypothetical protein